MATYTTTHRCTRVLLLLLGTRHEPVARALAKHGFGPAELALGFALLARMTEGNLDPEQLGAEEPPLLRLLHAWQSRWYPIIEVVLRTHFPAEHERVFRNLKQVRGAQVIVLVDVLLTRLDEMERRSDDGKNARTLLAKRGFTAEIMAEAAGYLHAMKTVTSDPLPPDRTAERERAERDLWAYYLEWSVILRETITDRRLLLSLGLLRGPKRGAGEG